MNGLMPCRGAKPGNREPVAEKGPVTNRIRSHFARIKAAGTYCRGRRLRARNEPKTLSVRGITAAVRVWQDNIRREAEQGPGQDQDTSGP
jgi:hypothetical protein